MKPYYQHGGITIYNCDCREILPRLETADLVLADPPYGIGYDSAAAGARGTPSKKWRAGGLTDYAAFSWDVALDAETIKAVVGAGAKQIVWGGNYYELGRCPRWLIWDKQTNGDFADCEMGWTNLEGCPRMFRYLWNGFAKQEPEPRFHPTQKPISLMRWCIGLAGNVRTVIDPLMGSGTTLRAAKDLGLQAIGIEIEERYCEIAAKRMAQSVFSFEETA